MKEFKDYFKIKNVIKILSEFNLVLGGFYFGRDSYLENNVNKNIGVAQLNKFFNDNYYNKIKNNQLLKEIIKKRPYIRLVYAHEELFLCFDYISFMNNILSELMFKSDNEIANYFKTITMYKPKKLSNDLINFIFQDMNECKLYKNLKFSGNEIRLAKFSLMLRNRSKIKQMDIDKLLSEQLKKLQEMSSLVKESVGVFEDFISVDELFKCFDYDKLCLIIAKSIYDEQLGAYKLEGKLFKQFHILTHYINCVEKYRNLNPKYNPAIYLSKKETIFTFDKLKKQYQELVSKDKTYSEDYFEDILFDEEFPWEILRPGNILEIRDQNISQDIFPIDDKKSTNSDVAIYESRKLRVIEGFNYLVQLNPLNIFKGIGKFEGYIGFKYENGIVVFEKIYDSNGKIAINNATYIMNKYNFKRFSSFTKTQIMFILNKSKTGIKRLYHTEDMTNWKQTIKGLINNQDYTPEDYDYIDELIALKEKEIQISKIKK